MVFQEVIEEGHHDLVIGDEAWDIDHFWHENPELKRRSTRGSPTSSATCRCPTAGTAKRP